MSEDGNSKLDELRRRYEHEPGSRVFVQLAEEYRKAGQIDEAIKVSLAGLAAHPEYATARVTLARCYLANGLRIEAEAEFERVVAAVPDNILANRSLGDLYYENGRRGEAAERYRVVQMLSPMDDVVEERLRELTSAGRTTASAAMPAHVAHSVSSVPPPKPAVGMGDDMAGFMDLKMDESVILNADMLASALGKTAAPAGEQGGDDFGDFSAPTMVMKTSDLAHIPGVSEPDSAKKVTQPPTLGHKDEVVAEGKRPEGLPSFAARSAQKFGIGSYGSQAPTVTPSPAAAPRPAEPPVGFDDDGGLGMDDFSEFAAPTVMLKASDLAAAGILAGTKADASPFAPAASLRNDLDAMDEPARHFESRLPAVSNPLEDDFASPVDDPFGRSVTPQDDLGTRAIAVEDIEAARRAAEVIVADQNPFGESIPRQSESPIKSAVPAPAPSPSPAVSVTASHSLPPTAVMPSLSVVAERKTAAPMEPRTAGEVAASVQVSTSPPSPPKPVSAPTVVADSTSAALGSTPAASPEVSGKTLAALYLHQGHLEQALRTYQGYAAEHPEDREVAELVAKLRGDLTTKQAAARPAASPPPSGDRQAKIAKLSNWLSSLKKS